MSKLPELTEAQRKAADYAAQAYVQADDRWNDFLAGEADEQQVKPDRPKDQKE